MPAAIPYVTAAIAAIGTGASIVQGNKQEKAQRHAAQQQKAAADRQAAQADQDFNRANQKQPDSVGILAAQKLAAQGGAGSTFLTHAEKRAFGVGRPLAGDCGECVAAFFALFAAG